MLKIVIVILQQVIKDIGVLILVDVLCIILGIIFGVGEGGNFVGDWLFICGFNVESDMFFDGMCDVVL